MTRLLIPILVLASFLVGKHYTALTCMVCSFDANPFIIGLGVLAIVTASFFLGRNLK